MDKKRAESNVLKGKRVQVKNILPLLIVVSFSAASCCLKAYLSHEDRIWLSAYEVGQILTFKSDKGKIDKIRIVRKKIEPPCGDCNWFEVSWYLRETGTIDYQFFHGGKWSETQNMLYIQSFPDQKSPTYPF